MNMPWLAGATAPASSSHDTSCVAYCSREGNLLYAAAGRAVRPAVGHGRDPTLGVGRVLSCGPVGLYIIAFVRYMAKCTYMSVTQNM